MVLWIKLIMVAVMNHGKWRIGMSSLRDICVTTHVLRNQIIAGTNGAIVREGEEARGGYIPSRYIYILRLVFFGPDQRQRWAVSV